MPFSEAEDWRAVIEAERIIQRIEFQNDLQYARGFDKKEIQKVQKERDKLVKNYERLMKIDRTNEDQRVKQTWDMLKAHKTSEGAKKMHVIKGGK